MGFFRRNKRDHADTDSHTPIAVGQAVAERESAPVTTDADRKVQAIAANIVESAGILKVVEEEVAVSKRAVRGETVRVHTETETVTQPFELNLRREDYDVAHVAKGEVVTSIPAIRKEGGITIIPVLEERLVTVKQIVLREEIHITPRHSVETERGEVELRRQKAVVERIPASEQS